MLIISHTLIQCCYTVGPASATLAQHCNSIGDWLYPPVSGLGSWGAPWGVPNQTVRGRTWRPDWAGLASPGGDNPVSLSVMVTLNPCVWIGDTDSVWGDDTDSQCLWRWHWLSHRVNPFGRMGDIDRITSTLAGRSNSTHKDDTVVQWHLLTTVSPAPVTSPLWWPCWSMVVTTPVWGVRRVDCLVLESRRGPVMSGDHS